MYCLMKIANTYVIHNKLHEAKKYREEHKRRKMDAELGIYILYITQALHLGLIFYEERSIGLPLCLYILQIKIYTHIRSLGSCSC